MPTYVSPTRGGNIVLLITNSGAAPTSATVPVLIGDSVPAGLTVTGVSANTTGEGMEDPVECEPPAALVSCGYHGVVPAENTGGITITIAVTPSAPGQAEALGPDLARVSGGEAAEASSSVPLRVSAEDPPFGLSDFAFDLAAPDGSAATQAGAHPNAVTVGFDLDSVYGSQPATSKVEPEPPLKGATVELPAGLVVDAQAAAKCPQALAQAEGGRGCPHASIVGTVAFSGAFPEYSISQVSGGEVSPLFDVVPEQGFPAELAFSYQEHTLFMFVSLAHTASGYVVRATVPYVPWALVSKSVWLTFFGDPSRFDGERASAGALFTDPEDCTEAPGASLAVSSWAGDEPAPAAAALPTPTGCDALAFEPKLSLAPESTQADSPTGVRIELEMPQNADPEGLATAELKDATVTLAPGMSLSPAGAAGLRGCPASGPEGIDLYAEGPLNADEPEGPPHLLAGHCPHASQIGTAKIETPVLESPLEGHVYLAEPECDACGEAQAEAGELVKIYVEAEGSGVNLKLPGTVEVGGAGPHSAQTGLAPGQLRVSFTQSPQQPVSEIELNLDGGPFAPLATPPTCGTATATSELVPWSSPETPDATPSSAFDVYSSAGACSATMPFAPGFSAGTTGTEAGSPTTFTLSFSREDGEQDLGAVAVSTPPGLVGLLSHVQRCAEPQAQLGQCGAASEIGAASVAAGAGPEPYWLSGHVYLTGPYAGAPFGLSIVVPAIAGPFNLGEIVVRATIAVNPTTAALTITSDPLPQSADGVPLRLKTVNITIDRPDFMINPTSCEAQAVAGTITGSSPGGGGTSVAVSNPFAPTGCRSLPFVPTVSAFTRAKTSKADGASLTVKLAYPAGVQADLRSIALELPKALPVQLKTLKQACAEAQFDADPAGCQPRSDIGQVVVHTPVLASALTGPAYLVSHGGAAFPDIEIVLQGEGVTLTLTGKTEIKQGVTYSHFETVPDAPISSFELTSHQGQYALLAAKGDLCDQRLLLPSRLTAQNGAVQRRSTVVRVEGCPAKRHPRAAKRHVRHTKRHVRAAKGR